MHQAEKQSRSEKNRGPLRKNSQMESCKKCRFSIRECLYHDEPNDLHLITRNNKTKNNYFAKCIIRHCQDMIYIFSDRRMWTGFDWLMCVSFSNIGAFFLLEQLTARQLRFISAIISHDVLKSFDNRIQMRCYWSRTDAINRRRALLWYDAFCILIHLYATKFKYLYTGCVCFCVGITIRHIKDDGKSRATREKYVRTSWLCTICLVKSLEMIVWLWD